MKALPSGFQPGDTILSIIRAREASHRAARTTELAERLFHAPSRRRVRADHGLPRRPETTINKVKFEYVAGEVMPRAEGTGGTRGGRKAGYVSERTEAVNHARILTLIRVELDQGSCVRSCCSRGGTAWGSTATVHSYSSIGRGYGRR